MPGRLVATEARVKDTYIRGLKERNAHLTEAVQHLVSDNTALKEKNKRMARYKAQNCDMLSQLKDMRERVGAAEAERDAAACERDAALDKARDEAGRAAMARESARLCDQRLRDSHGAVERLQGLRRTLQSHLGVLTGEVVLSAQDMGRGLRTLRLRAQQAEASKAELAAMQDAVKHLSHTAEQMSLRLIEESKQRNFAERRNVLLQAELDALRARLAKMGTAEYRGRVAGSQTQVSLAEHEFAIGAMQAEVDTQRAQAESLMMQLDFAHQECQEYAEQQAALVGQLKKLHLDRDRNQGHVATLQQEIDALQSQLAGVLPHSSPSCVAPQPCSRSRSPVSRSPEAHTPRLESARPAGGGAGGSGGRAGSPSQLEAWQAHLEQLEQKMAEARHADVMALKVTGGYKDDPMTMQVASLCQNMEVFMQYVDALRNSPIQATLTASQDTDAVA